MSNLLKITTMEAALTHLTRRKVTGVWIRRTGRQVYLYTKTKYFCRLEYNPLTFPFTAFELDLAIDSCAEMRLRTLSTEDVR